VHQVDLTAESGISWNGYRLTVACSCGVTFERLITPWDAELDLLRLARLATRGNVHSSVANRCGARRIRLGANWVQRCRRSDLLKELRALQSRFAWGTRQSPGTVGTPEGGRIPEEFAIVPTWHLNGHSTATACGESTEQTELH
jgi:hypothetical protein